MSYQRMSFSYGVGCDMLTIPTPGIVAATAKFDAISRPVARDETEEHYVIPTIATPVSPISRPVTASDITPIATPIQPFVPEVVQNFDNDTDLKIAIALSEQSLLIENQCREVSEHDLELALYLSEGLGRVDDGADCVIEEDVLASASAPDLVFDAFVPVKSCPLPDPFPALSSETPSETRRETPSEPSSTTTSSVETISSSTSSQSTSSPSATSASSTTSECVVCMENDRCIVFKPCGHVCCCEKCSEHMLSSSSPKCPLCRQDLKSRSKTKVFV